MATDPRDAWRDTYDNWKLATPPEYEEDEEREEEDPDVAYERMRDERRAGPGDADYFPPIESDD